MWVIPYFYDEVLTLF